MIRSLVDLEVLSQKYAQRYRKDGAVSPHVPEEHILEAARKAVLRAAETHDPARGSFPVYSRRCALRAIRRRGRDGAKRLVLTKDEARGLSRPDRAAEVAARRGYPARACLVCWHPLSSERTERHEDCENDFPRGYVRVVAT